MARRRSIKGVGRVRRIIRTLPDTMTAELRHVLNDAGPRLARQMQARAPRRTGKLQAGIKWKVLPKTLKLQVGLLGTKAGRSKLFYGRILDRGRKAQVVQVRRLKAGGGKAWTAMIAAGTARASRKPAALTTTYSMSVKPIAPMRFVTGRYPDLFREMNVKLKAVWSRVLAKAAAGAGDE